MKRSLKPSKPETSGLKVIVKDVKIHPQCPHGPTLLFSREDQKQFYACSACRDRKLCNFFLRADDAGKVSKLKLEAWDSERKKFLRGINHKKLFLLLNKVKALSSHKRSFCNQCNIFTLGYESKHKDHSLISNITDFQLEHPLEILTPLENGKKEAQYLFSKESVKFLVDTFMHLKYKNVICIGTPRIHEYIRSNSTTLSSILLDLDSRFHNFFGPLEFCWYNSFNNHFFFEEAREVFNNFMQTTKGENTVLVTDPPFGGRIEPLAQTFSIINVQYKNLNNGKCDLPLFWIFPYFMEPQMLNYVPDIHMIDYKVQYDNHPLFQNGPKGRKQGSPVRIFTNIDPGNIKLPSDNYKFCQHCNKWVAKENRHCNICKDCTSKNGETYNHCDICGRCVKPSWRHCKECQRCAQIKHDCSIITFSGICLNCNKPGHKKSECQQMENPKLISCKRKKKNKLLGNKKLKS